MSDVCCVGHASWDITMAVAHHPGADEKTVADAMQLAGGGPAANAAVCIARLGGDAAFCGYLGSDLFGEAHLHELQDAGVDSSAVLRGTYPTPLSQILAKPDGLRSVVNFKGDTPHLSADALQRLPQARVLLFDGHEPELSKAICAEAVQHGSKTVLDAGSLHRGTALLAPEVDYLVASARFAAQFCHTDDMQLALSKLAGICPHVVITLGADGLLWASEGRQGRMPAFRVDCVDSTGAGDAFHGAFALGLVRAMVWPDLLRYASAAGALTCTRLGARQALPDATAVQRLLSEQPGIVIENLEF
ncbi:carbohydrate kinase family protein [Mariprofundus ferrooxydans]|uniref:carbohydrate kinase family protein n=1 Tax=Mariprofundus ferrooxydans TaxID=314344 RepID=UPI0014303042|nr:PfkB family carbohydrate kinase [Mariprofundus ferrooxydans]